LRKHVSTRKNCLPRLCLKPQAIGQRRAGRDKSSRVRLLNAGLCKAVISQTKATRAEPLLAKGALGVRSVQFDLPATVRSGWLAGTAAGGWQAAGRREVALCPRLKGCGAARPPTAIIAQAEVWGCEQSKRTANAAFGAEGVAAARFQSSSHLRPRACRLSGADWRDPTAHPSDPDQSEVAGPGLPLDKQLLGGRRGAALRAPPQRPPDDPSPPPPRNPAALPGLARGGGRRGPGSDGRPRGRPQQRRSRSVVSVLLFAFSAPSRPTRRPRTRRTRRRRRRQATTAASAAAAAGAQSDADGTTQRDPASAPHSLAMKLKRERCPKCHGVLPLKTPDLEPVLVRPGQARRRHEIKEDSGCIIAGRVPKSPLMAPGPQPSAAWRTRATFSMSSGAGSSTRQPEPPLPLARPPMSGLYGTGFLHLRAANPQPRRATEQPASPNSYFIYDILTRKADSTVAAA
uniref:SH2 domain-containing protein n=1 Tax=Macrostomum lignano TaxID=282301 RepID=A0A1I8F2W0_9PLAT